MKRSPVVVHTMGRVGSFTIATSIAHLGLFETFHTHFLDSKSVANLRKRMENRSRPWPESIEAAIAVSETVLPESQQIKMITLVRDPVARNISACFAGFTEQSEAGDESPLDREKVKQIFDSFFHERPARWFENEFHSALGIDLLAIPFPKEQGFGRYQFDKIDLLVMQNEIPDNVKREQLADFLEIGEINLIRKNDQMLSDPRYVDFKAQVPLTEEYLDRLYGLPFVSHFYNDQAIQGFRRRWTPQT